MSASLMGALLLFVVTSPIVRATIIENGDFEAGNTGFTSEFTYTPPGPGSLDTENFYTVDTNPRNNSNLLLSIGDHTTGTGLMMIVNGSGTTGTLLWQGTVSSPLTVGQEYDLSFWVAAISTAPPPALKLTVGSTPINTIAPAADGTWMRSVSTFTAQEAFPTFRLDAFAGTAGNDFAVDDIDVFLVGTETNPPIAGPLLNISTRLQVLTADQVPIGGFIVTGNEPKTVILRALGPSLGNFGISDPLANPVLELRAGDGSLIKINDDWTSDRGAIEPTGFQPTSGFESAILATLDPGSYTAVVSGKNGGTGVGLVEVYDLDQAADSQLANISTRGFVATEGNVMIGGFILGGETGGSGNVLIRAIGPTLSLFGVTGALADPTLELRDAQGTLISSNDNWKVPNQLEIEETHLQPQMDEESALLEALPAGAYTAIVAGVGETTGVGLVEVYRLP
ncbi:MAG: hypothetical protein ABIS71_05610 [Chthoniobacterales bacterium]